MRRDRVLRLALAALALPLLAIPATAQGTVTIGSGLQRSTMASTSCLPNCTAVLGDLSPDAQASGGVASPVNGTVTTWRLGVGNKAGPTAFRVVRRLPDGTYTGGGASAVVTPMLNMDNVFPTSLPIQRGDLIGIDCCAAPGVTYFTADHQGQRILFEPGFLGDGAAGATPSGTDTFELLLNADIEPTSAFTVTKVRRKKGNAISATVQVPNPGTLVAGDPNDYALGAPGVQALLLKPGVADVSPGPVTVTTRPTQRARDILARRGRLRVRVKILFTPTHGLPASHTVKVRLKG
ncbi:MAG TPA: hypothetical protein VFY30_12185 [Solirubrobacterales bacterium]|nr:hypothetical protein [Solirubrobacterales bacterium]